MTTWKAALPVVAATLVLAGCASSNSNKNKVSATAAAATVSATNASASTTTTIQPAAGSPRATTGTPIAAPVGAGQSQPAGASNPMPSSTGVAGQVEQKLIAALISGGDIPSSLTVQNARQPLNNHQFAGGQNNPAAFEKAQADAGRISGALITYSSPDAANPSASTGEETNLLIILSDYASPMQASAALPNLIKLVTPATSDPHSFTVAKQDVTIGTFGDETSAEAMKISAVLGGRPDTLVWVVGVRRGAVNELYVVTGVGGQPTADQVRETISRQDARIASAGL